MGNARAHLENAGERRGTLGERRGTPGERWGTPENAGEPSAHFPSSCTKVLGKDLGIGSVSRVK